jgi:hypothetical protein
MELEITDRLNILGAEITFLGDGFAVLAARKAAEQKQEKNVERKKQLDEEANELNKFANWITLLGDFISALAAELEAQKNIEDINNDQTKLNATNLNIISSWLIVFGDALAVQAQALEESTSEDTTAP